MVYRCFSVSLVLIIFQLIDNTNSARILGIVPIPSYSHQIAFQPLWIELSRRGHQVVTLTTNPINDPTLTNLTEIDLSFCYTLDFIGTVQRQLQQGELSAIGFVELFAKAIADTVVEQLKHPQVQQLINNEREHFDVVLVEAWIPVMFAFSERFNCPLIGIISLDASFLLHRIMGNPAHPVLYPEPSLPFVGELNFKERIISSLFQLFLNYYKKFVLDVRDQKIVETFFKNNTKHKIELEQNISLLFTNTNPILHGNRPLAPNTIPFGGAIQMKPIRPLPADISDFLNNATNGVIYCSLGSNIQAKDLDPKLIKIFIDTFRGLPYHVLWKFEADRLENKPDNVKIVKWVSQQDVLSNSGDNNDSKLWINRFIVGHPNIKLFVTQGGLQSLEEAMFSFVPMVGMPFFADQMANVKRLEYKNMGVYLDFKTLTVDEFRGAIIEVIDNPKYRETIREMVEFIKDQPMSGLEKAVWWTEYVIRHKGAKYFSNPNQNLPFYQYFLLDVIGFCLLVILVAILVIIYTIKLIFKCFKIIFSAIKVKKE